MYAKGETGQRNRRSWWPWMAAALAALFLTLLTGCATGRGSSSPVPDRWPTAERWPVTSAFGAQRGVRQHSGMDVSAPKGTPVYATAPGRVVFGGRDRAGYGKLVKIDHGGGLQTWYAHLSRRAVHEGEYVLRGQKLGRVGKTGRATGPHLHYEVRVEGAPVDPQGYLEVRPMLAQAGT